MNPFGYCVSRLFIDARSRKCYADIIKIISQADKEGRIGQMDAMSSLIAENLKNIRKENKWSLDAVSEMTGVSKSMLGQIERGESSPTVATLWKIATGLHISFTGLLEQTEQDAQIIPKTEVKALLNDGGHFRLYPFFPYSKERRFEMLSIEMDPGSRSDSEAHEAGTEEFVLVYEGCLILEADGKRHVVEEGNGIHFQADRPHVYENGSSSNTRICMLIYYQK